jgi:hypothetical protein
MKPSLPVLIVEAQNLVWIVGDVISDDQVRSYYI